MERPASSITGFAGYNFLVWQGDISAVICTECNIPLGLEDGLAVAHGADASLPDQIAHYAKVTVAQHLRTKHDIGTPATSEIVSAISDHLRAPAPQPRSWKPSDVPIPALKSLVAVVAYRCLGNGATSDHKCTFVSRSSQTMAKHVTEKRHPEMKSQTMKFMKCCAQRGFGKRKSYIHVLGGMCLLNTIDSSQFYSHATSRSCIFRRHGS